MRKRTSRNQKGILRFKNTAESEDWIKSLKNRWREGRKLEIQSWRSKIKTPDPEREKLRRGDHQRSLKVSRTWKIRAAVQKGLIRYLTSWIKAIPRLTTFTEQKSKWFWISQHNWKQDNGATPSKFWRKIISHREFYKISNMTDMQDQKSSYILPLEATRGCVSLKWKTIKPIQWKTKNPKNGSAQEGSKWKSQKTRHKSIDLSRRIQDTDRLMAPLLNIHAATCCTLLNLRNSRPRGAWSELSTGWSLPHAVTYQFPIPSQL